MCRKHCEEIDIGYSHGTVCALAFLERSMHKQLICISMLGEFNAHSFLHAAILCCEKCAHIVLCCFGTTNGLSVPLIRRCIDALKKHHVQIVAACSNIDTVTFPASMSNVLGVRCFGVAQKCWSFLYDHKACDGIEVSLRVPTITIIEQLNRIHEYCVPYSNSIAAAFVTGEYVKQVHKNMFVSIFDYYQDHHLRESALPYLQKNRRHIPQEPIVVLIDNVNLANSMQISLQTLGYVSVMCNYVSNTCIEQFCIGSESLSQVDVNFISLFDADFFIYRYKEEIVFELSPDITIYEASHKVYCDSEEGPLLVGSTVGELALQVIKRFVGDRNDY